MKRWKKKDAKLEWVHVAWRDNTQGGWDVISRKSGPSDLAEQVARWRRWHQGSAELLLLPGREGSALKGCPGITLQEAIQSGISSLNLAMPGITN